MEMPRRTPLTLPRPPLGDTTLGPKWEEKEKRWKKGQRKSGIDAKVDELRHS